MKKLSVDGKQFSIHFRYLSRYGKRPHFGRHTPFQAITICTILADQGNFIAQDVAVCSSAVAPKPTPAMHRVFVDLIQVASLFDRWGVDREIQANVGDHLSRAYGELAPDQYSRREGRLISLSKTLERCGALRRIKDEFLRLYLETDPPPAVPQRVRISDERKEELIASGQEGKVERRLERKKNKSLRKGV